MSLRQATTNYLGSAVANVLGAKVGDYLTLMIPTVNGVGEGSSNFQTFESKSLVCWRLTSNRSQLINPNWRCLRNLMEAVTGVSLKVTDVLNANSIVREVGKLDVYVLTCSWQQKFGFLYRDIQLVCTTAVSSDGIGYWCGLFQYCLYANDGSKRQSIRDRNIKNHGRIIGRPRNAFSFCRGVISGVLGSLRAVQGVLVALYSQTYQRLESWSITSSCPVILLCRLFRNSIRMLL